MKIGPFEISRKQTLSINQLVERLEAALSVASGEAVTPDSALEAPTVQAIATAVSRRIAISPVEVFAESTVRGRKRRTPAKDTHPIVRLMRRPNMWQPRANYWLDQSSHLLRHGAAVSFKRRDGNNIVHDLLPLHMDAITVTQNPAAGADPFGLTFKYATANGGEEIYGHERIHYARGPSRDFVTPDSPVMAVRESIGLELAAEKFAASFFGNSALPFLVFKLMDGFAGFRTEADEKSFLAKIADALTGRKRHSSLVLPAGMDISPMNIEQEKAQFIETRKMVRTVIAGAFGVPPHLVGDLERATFNNVEQQDGDFVLNVIAPIARQFEDAMERDLLSDNDRAENVKIRFDLDAMQRVDFKGRQEALRLQREWGVINADEWREEIGRNPLAAGEGGDTYIRPMNMADAGAPAANDEPPPPAEDDEDEDA